MLMIVTVKPSICMQSRRAGVQKTYTTVNHSRLICRLAAIFISGGGGGGGGFCFGIFCIKDIRSVYNQQEAMGDLSCVKMIYLTLFFLELLCLN